MIYNVLVGVVELIEADSEDDAVRILSERVSAAGFDTYESAEDTPTIPHAFKSEPVSLPPRQDDPSEWADAYPWGTTPPIGTR